MKTEKMFDAFGEIDNRYILEADKVLHLSRGEAGLLAPVLPEETKGA